jgi:hypothetical protein
MYRGDGMMMGSEKSGKSLGEDQMENEERGC